MLQKHNRQVVKHREQQIGAPVEKGTRVYERSELSYRRQDLTNSHCSCEPWLRTAKHHLTPREKNGHSSRNYVLKYLRLVKAACLVR